jgi:hypothetical protein
LCCNCIHPAPQRLYTPYHHIHLTTICTPRPKNVPTRHSFQFCQPKHIPCAISQMQRAITPITILTPSCMLPIYSSLHTFNGQAVLSACARYLPLGVKNPHPRPISTSQPPTTSATLSASPNSILSLLPSVVLHGTTRAHQRRLISHFGGQSHSPALIFCLEAYSTSTTLLALPNIILTLSLHRFAWHNQGSAGAAHFTILGPNSLPRLDFLIGGLQHINYLISITQ